jgi:hypothetical protein
MTLCFRTLDIYGSSVGAISQFRLGMYRRADSTFTRLISPITIRTTVASAQLSPFKTSLRVRIHCASNRNCRIRVVRVDGKCTRRKSLAAFQLDVRGKNPRLSRATIRPFHPRLREPRSTSAGNEKEPPHIRNDLSESTSAPRTRFERQQQLDPNQLRGTYTGEPFTSLESFTLACTTRRMMDRRAPRSSSPGAPTFFSLLGALARRSHNLFCDHFSGYTSLYSDRLVWDQVFSRVAGISMSAIKLHFAPGKATNMNKYLIRSLRF